MCCSKLKTELRVFEFSLLGEINGRLLIDLEGIFFVSITKRGLLIGRFSAMK